MHVRCICLCLGLMQGDHDVTSDLCEEAREDRTDLRSAAGPGMPQRISGGG